MWWGSPGGMLPKHFNNFSLISIEASTKFYPFWIIDTQGEILVTKAKIKFMHKKISGVLERGDIYPNPVGYFQFSPYPDHILENFNKCPPGLGRVRRVRSGWAGWIAIPCNFHYRNTQKQEGNTWTVYLIGPLTCRNHDPSKLRKQIKFCLS